MSSPVDPESLFHSLRERDREIRHLWSQQADALRIYHKEHERTSDIAIELPTGAGKTLVGLLIGEWRRRAHSERVAYLCPTRQLAKQVHRQAKSYGVKANVLVGSQSDYPQREFVEYKSSQAVAVTTYAAIFNVNPRIDDAQLLILDDAHAGENSIAHMWSVDVSRAKQSDLYVALLKLFRNAIDASAYDELSDAQWDPKKAGLLELVPGSIARRHARAVRDLLTERLPVKAPSRYAWDTIRPHLDACSIFISWHGFLIRPFVPPTLTHPAFERAKQRIFMSATLGAGGELERVAGVRHIERIPLPSGWDRRGTGRRLFVIPELALSSDETVDVAASVVQVAGRGLILTPNKNDEHRASIVRAVESRGIPMLNARDIEDSMDLFVGKESAALVLERYDGLDLPDETCRCIVLAGLPSGTNLQERFLWSKVTAHALLRDRVLTRFVQGAGRCTRSDNDYALVLIVGRQLRDFLLKNENRRILNPELQAELKFGIENSRDKRGGDFARLCQAFATQGEEWRGAETAIVGLRESFSRRDDPVSGKLKEVVADEVDYQYAKWRGDLEGTLGHARKVADALGGDEIKAYRAWWYYLSADASMALYENNGENAYSGAARDLLGRAGICCPGVHWFACLDRRVASTTNEIGGRERTATAVEGIRRRLTEWGIVGKGFERRVSDIERNLKSTAHRKFHQGLKGLGEMLGFESDLPKTDAAPDCVWSLGHGLYIVHEAKSEHTPTDSIGVNDVRQAASHGNWIRAERTCDSRCEIVCVVESPRQTVAGAAIPHARDLWHVHPGQLIEIFDSIAALLRRVRAKIITVSEEEVIEELVHGIDGERLTPEAILVRLKQQPVSRMKQAGVGRERHGARAGG